MNVTKRPNKKNKSGGVRLLIIIRISGATKWSLCAHRCAPWQMAHYGDRHLPALPPGLAAS